jgi:hypothetical protein
MAGLTVRVAQGHHTVLAEVTAAHNVATLRFGQGPTLVKIRDGVIPAELDPQPAEYVPLELVDGDESREWVPFLRALLLHFEDLAVACDRSIQQSDVPDWLEDALTERAPKRVKTDADCLQSLLKTQLYERTTAEHAAIDVFTQQVRVWCARPRTTAVDARQLAVLLGITNPATARRLAAGEYVPDVCPHTALASVRQYINNTLPAEGMLVPAPCSSITSNMRRRLYPLPAFATAALTGARLQDIAVMRTRVLIDGHLPEVFLGICAAKALDAAGDYEDAIIRAISTLWRQL